MSIMVSTICLERKLGSATRKQVMMFLADKASDDGSGIWCSKHSIARFTELNLSTVKRTIKDFLAEQLIIETGQRPNSHGFTIEYVIDLDAIACLESLNKTEGTTHPVHIAPPKQLPVHPQDGAQSPPNHPLTIQQPPINDNQNDLEKLFNHVWMSYPEDKKRFERRAYDSFLEAVKDGHNPDDILSAVKTYAKTTEHYSRDKVKFADNWFKERSWSKHVIEHNEKLKKCEDALEQSLQNCTRWIKQCNPMCKYITTQQLKIIIERKLVNHVQVQLAGLEV